MKMTFRDYLPSTWWEWIVVVILIMAVIVFLVGIMALSKSLAERYISTNSPVERGLMLVAAAIVFHAIFGKDKERKLDGKIEVRHKEIKY